MEKVEEITSAITSTDKPFYKVKHGGESYSIFQGTKAFKQIESGEIKVGSERGIDYELNGKYKNIKSFVDGEGTKPTPQEKLISTTNLNSKDVSIAKAVALKASLYFFEVNMSRIPGKDPISEAQVVKTARYFEEEYLRVEKKEKAEK